MEYARGILHKFLFISKVISPLLIRKTLCVKLFCFKNLSVLHTDDTIDQKFS